MLQKSSFIVGLFFLSGEGGDMSGGLNVLFLQRKWFLLLHSNYALWPHCIVVHMGAGNAFRRSTAAISTIPMYSCLTLVKAAPPLSRIMVEVPVMVAGSLHIDNAVHPQSMVAKGSSQSKVLVLYSREKSECKEHCLF